MQRFAALDTKFILALAGGEADAEATIDYLQKNGFFPIITESVHEQLGELASTPQSAACEAAKYASKWLTTWGIIEIPNSYTANGTSQVHAESILQQGLIPGATEIEAEVLVEASCQNCELLVTFSESLLNAPATVLNLALIERGLDQVTVIIASPSQIAARLALQNAPTQ